MVGPLCGGAHPLVALPSEIRLNQHMLGPDLPAPTEPFTPDAQQQRWPTAATACELIDGALIFTGKFDQRDVEIAQRTYPGRRVQLGPDNGLEIYPGGTTWTIWDQWGGVEVAKAAMDSNN